MSAPSSETQAIQHTSRTVRRLLATGFGGLLAIMVVAGLMALRTLADLHAAEEAARRDYLVRNQALSTVNVSITCTEIKSNNFFWIPRILPSIPALLIIFPLFLQMLTQLFNNIQSRQAPPNDSFSSKWIGT